MDIDKETERQIAELQILEQNLQNILMQKQAFQLELSETENALEEIKKAEGEIYRIVGQIMIKSKKEQIEKELVQKQQLISARIKSFDNSERNLSKTTEELRLKVMGKIKK